MGRSPKETSTAKTATKKRKVSTKPKKANVLNSKKVKKINRRQALRAEKISQYKKSGHMGEGDQGLLVLRTKKGLSQKSAAELRKIVTLENKDRSALMKMIIDANKYDATEIKILRNSFFDTYLMSDPEGVYYYQNKHWVKK